MDAKPTMNNQTNETVVSFSLDRVGAKKFGKATSNGVGKRLAIVLDGKIISLLKSENQSLEEMDKYLVILPFNLQQIYRFF